MHNDPLVHELLTQINGAIETIQYRFEPIKSIDDFLDSPQGMEKLDSICMLFVAIGEGLKKIDTLTNKQLLVRYEGVDWKGIKGMRDILSHHYFDLNAEAVYIACNEELGGLRDAIRSMIDNV
jgi:uncharacterized protein with HEPN domain